MGWGYDGSDIATCPTEEDDVAAGVPLTFISIQNLRIFAGEKAFARRLARYDAELRAACERGKPWRDRYEAFLAHKAEHGL